jgi:pimeloyl-ACP methyl ester carboxylesterase
MKRKEIFFSITALVVLLTGCLTLNTKSVQAAQHGETIAVETYEKPVSMLAQSSGVAPVLISQDKTQLIDDIYKYSFIFKVGDGAFDKIGVYRVVKEKQSVPIKAKNAVMMVHGETSDFDSEFLMSTMSDKVSVCHSLGIYLAQNNVDVWGVDRRWTFVPDYYPKTTDPYCYIDGCYFMEDWDTALHLSDIKIAVKFAREIRDETGSGSDKIFMLGHSRGAVFAYAYANDETQIDECSRDLIGIIPVDMVYKFDPDDPAQTRLIENSCLKCQKLQEKFNSGIFYSDKAVGLKYIAYLAALFPDKESDIIPGFTNQEAVWFVLSATYMTEDDPFYDDSEMTSPPVPFYHYCAGTFNKFGLPTGLQFTNSDYMLDFAFAVPSFQSLGEAIDVEALRCSDDTPYDDHLGEIIIPVFYVGAAGGYGKYGVYTTTLLGSYDKDKPDNNDVDTLIVELYPPEAVALDYGHIDLLFADDAESLVWKPIYKWIKKTH